MPKKAHENLEKQARKKGLTGKRGDAYVYGTLNKIDKGRPAANPKKERRR